MVFLLMETEVFLPKSFQHYLNMIQEKSVEEIIADLLSDDSELRQKAESSLKDYPPEKMLPKISTLLYSPEKNIRKRGMEIFCCMGCDSTPSLALLLNDDEWVVRYRAAEALGIIGGDAARNLLVSALQDSRDHVRYMAAKGLGLSLRTETAGAVAALLNDENEFVRASSARSLGQMNIAAYAPLIKAALQKEKFEKTRGVMAEALIRLCGES